MAPRRPPSCIAGLNEQLLSVSGDDDPTLCRYTASGIEVPMANGNVIKIPVADSDINISEEMNKSGLWKSVDQGQNNGNGPHKNDG